MENHNIAMRKKIVLEIKKFIDNKDQFISLS